MEVENQRIINVVGDKTHPTNQGRLCTKGKSCAQAITAAGRLDRAWLRTSRQQQPVPVGIDSAITQTAQRLREIIDHHGPDALALYVSGQMSLEAQYLANKLAKGFIGTQHIESNSRLCMASAASGYKLSLGADGPPGSYDDFDRADLFLVIGANMADCHPILFLRMMDRVKAGAKLIVVDPRRTATAEKASLFLQIKPGTDLALLNGLLGLLVQNGQIDETFIEQCTEGWQAMPDFLQDYLPQQVAERTGLAEADIRQAAQWIGEAAEWMSCWTMGLNQSTHGTWSTNALCNLHLATGAICRPGSGPFSLTGQPNAMGGREVGYMGAGLPGQRSLLVEKDRAFVEQLWQRPPGSLRSDSGHGTVSMFDEMRAGKIKACWIICTNPVATVPNRQQVIAALQQAELVITQDAFLDTETNRYADILLPGALWAEAEGVMINSERTMTLMQQAVLPPGEALADWKIIARVACEMGYADGFTYASAAEVFDEIRQSYNPDTGYDIRGASHARLREMPLQWPCPPDDTQQRHPIRYLQHSATARVRFATASGKAQFFARPDLAPVEMPDDEFPLVLNTGRVQHQWHTLTKTGKIPMLNQLNPGPFVEIAPQDAERLNIRAGEQVDIRSRRGLATLPAVITDRVSPGTCFAPFHWNDLFGDRLAINAVTSDAVDPISLQPELKHAAVALTRSAQQPVMSEKNAVTAPATPGVLLVRWASMTGHAQAFARRCAGHFLDAGQAVKLRGMESVSVADIAAASHVLLVASTFGDGDPPDNGAALWTALESDSAPELTGTAFSVLAFGDASYDRFCGFGRKLDARLAALGAQRLVARHECDAGDNAPAQQWLNAVQRALLGEVIAETSETQPKPGFSRHQPLTVPLVVNQRLNASLAQKEIRQVVFDLQGSGMHYEAGDALGVWPINCPQQVDQILRLLELDAQTPVQLSDKGEMTLREALTNELDITRITPEIVQFVCEQTGNAALKTRLDNTEELSQWLWGRQLSDLLQMSPVRAPAQAWLSVLRRLQPRFYSISSSPKVSPQQVALTVATVRYGEGNQRGGVCSTFLADRATSAAVFIHSSPHFRLPANPQTPVIMVGAGTGIAPFRGFLQERQATAAPGRNWLFFGEQHAAMDFWYQEELEAWQRDGVLHRLSTAFSRDQAEKIYVQHRMVEEGAELWRWLCDGACFYVCGDASQMAKDVDEALKQVVQTFGGMRAEEASDWVAALAREKRYQRDVY
jgi:NADPH-dependent sulfite reductase flavoprotein alpha-component